MPDSSGGFNAPRLLATVDYPIDKEALLQKAFEIDAPVALRDAIGRLRSGSFETRSELVAAIEAITTPSSDL